jgi:RimJ/RimL family protein N-acetyltransferase
MIATERLVLRRFRASDLPTFVGYRADPDVARWQGWSDFTEADGRKFLDAMVDVEPFVPGHWIQLACEERATGAHVGDVACMIDAAELTQATIGYTLAREHQGKGLATEAVRGLVGHLFGTLGLHRVIASTDPRNVPSVRVLERVGFRREAHHVQSMWFKGDWVDDAVFAMLRREWRLG